jgi:hypothetical protein
MRRLPLVGTLSHASFCEGVRRAWPALAGSCLVLKYVDDEGDLVGVDSDSELAEAFALAQRCGQKSVRFDVEAGTGAETIDKRGAQPQASGEEVATYIHSAGQLESVTVIKRHSHAEGGGATIMVPSLGRERMTETERLLPPQEALPHSSSPAETALSAPAAAKLCAQPVLTSGAPLAANNDTGTTDSDSTADYPARRASSSLYAAGFHGHLPVVAALLKAGVDKDFRDPHCGCTALYAASQQGHLAVVEALLAAGADPDAKSSTGSTALQAASGAGHLDVVEALLRTSQHAGASGFSSSGSDGQNASLFPRQTVALLNMHEADSRSRRRTKPCSAKEFEEWTSRAMRESEFGTVGTLMRDLFHGLHLDRMLHSPGFFSYISPGFILVLHVVFHGLFESWLPTPVMLVVTALGVLATMTTQDDKQGKWNTCQKAPAAVQTCAELLAFRAVMAFLPDCFFAILLNCALAQLVAAAACLSWCMCTGYTGASQIQQQPRLSRPAPTLIYRTLAQRWRCQPATTHGAHMASRPGASRTGGSRTGGNEITSADGRNTQKRGELAGEGVATFRSGWVVSTKGDGTFKNGELNGRGVRSSPTGTIIEAGNFVDSKLDGDGERATECCGGLLVEKGTFERGELHGEGLTMFSTNGIQQTPIKGIFKHGELLAASYFGRPNPTHEPNRHQQLLRHQRQQRQQRQQSRMRERRGLRPPYEMAGRDAGW